MITRKTRKRKSHAADDAGSDPIDIHVGHRLRQARRLAGLNQSQLGAAIGVSFQAVQKYENGDNRLSASRLFMAAQALRCTVPYFFEGIDPRSGGISGTIPDRDQVELIRSFRLIVDPAIREQLRLLFKEIYDGYAATRRDDCDRREVS